jgi:hypothetical protein
MRTRPVVKDDSIPAELIPDQLKKEVICNRAHTTLPIGIDVNQVKVLTAPGSGCEWIGVANVTLKGQQKHLVFCFSGYGSFDFNFTETARDPVLGITFPSDANWTLYRGFDWQGKKYGSWGFVVPGKADLSYPEGAFRGLGRISTKQWWGNSLEKDPVEWNAVETSLPLSQIWLADGKVAAIQFGDGPDAIVLIPIAK